MSFDSGVYMAEEGIAEVIGMLLSMLGSNMMGFAWTVAAYILTGLGLYTIAQRRGIKHAWMAWVPVLNVWILGSIADQYRYVAKGEVRSRRKVLIVLAVLQTVAVIVIYVMLIGMVVNMIMQIPSIDRMTEDQALGLVMDMLMGTLVPMIALLLVMGIVAIVSAVFRCIAYYDLFASCDPENKVLFLVLGILLSVTLPFFVFACRKKDRGMPPRRSEQPPVMEAPVMEAPEEPWANSEE